MNDRTFQVLEFDKIIDMLMKHTATSLGTEKVVQLSPSTDINEVQNMQFETDEAAQILRLNADIPLGGITDVRDGIKRSVIGGILDSNDCLDIANTIYGGRQAKEFIENVEEELPILTELASRITPLRNLEQQINNCIDENGDVKDSASVKLRGIRSSIRTFETRVRERLDNFTKTKSNLLSDSIITIRNSRYVLPVKHEFRNAVGGIVHDQSASGQTLFIEPQSVVDLNNQLQEATLKERQEIDRILKEISEEIASHQTYLTENIIVLAQIDFITSKAKLGREMKASMPEINNKGIINLQQVRHPLISADEVVPNNIEIGDSYTSILITGPNTGGKTVVLKMVGLCTLMTQSGLQIPARDGCQMAVFQHVFADIGDEQSIEQNLSTFSSHMTNIVNILQDVDDHSLVLFDELGAGTDPQEGAALAMSILDEVISRHARVIATTHYPELKAYGYNRGSVVNASVEFDVETLHPTYRLLIGVPGSSNAFEISRRLGLNESIIEQAKGHIGIDSKSVNQMIKSLENSQREAEKEYDQARQILFESKELRAEVEKAWNQLQHNREKIYKNAEEKAEKALQKARDEAELIVREIRNMKTETTFKEHEWIEAKKLLEDASPELSQKNNDKNIPNNQETQIELKPGDDVKLITLNQTGTILEKISDNEYLVQAGIMKVNVKRKDLELVNVKKQEQMKKPVTMVKGSNVHVSTEFDLRGERYENALHQLDQYTDDALLAGHSQALIIHGKGTGALRKGVHKFAEKHPQISSYRFGKEGEGGSGVTVFEFK